MKSGKTTWEQTLKNLAEKAIFPAKVHRILLYGPPRTGKSSWAQYQFGVDKVERVPIHRQQYPEDLVGGMQLCNGSTVFLPGPAARCMGEGKILVLDEIDQFSPECRVILHAVLDDRSIASLSTPQGIRITPTEGFGVIATTNESPDCLPDALRDRFDVILCADVPAQAILDSLPTGAANALRNRYERANVSKYQPVLSVSTELARARLVGVMDENEAAALVYGNAATELLSLMAVAS